MRFIGIDYSTTSTGVAICGAGEWDTFSLASKPNGTTLGDYYDRIIDLAYRIESVLHDGDVLGIEGIAFAARGQKVDRLHYAWHRTVEHLTTAHSALHVVTTNQVKQLATGKGTAKKDEVLLAAERRIPQAQVTNNDEADAVWIAVGASILAGSPVIDLPAAHMPKAWKKSELGLAGMGKN